MAIVYKWRCENPECEMKNVADQSLIDEAVAKGLKPLLVCELCGYVYQFSKKGTPEGANWCECIPFLGPEKKLPLGRMADGSYTDYQGRPFSRNKFIIAYGVDPMRYIHWRDAGKPIPR